MGNGNTLDDQTPYEAPPESGEIQVVVADWRGIFKAASAASKLYSVSKGIYPKEIGGPDPVPPPPKNGTNGTGEK